MQGLLESEKCERTLLAILIQYTNNTNKHPRTDGHRTMAYRRTAETVTISNIWYQQFCWRAYRYV